MNARNAINALTIDIEDYFQVAAFKNIVNFNDWEKYECRVEKNTFKILEILNQFNVKATFFVLGWIAERYPNLIKEIHREGHEIASHGYAHRLIYEQTKEAFRQDIKKAKSILEDITGERVIGYRAPSYSITQKTFWALKILREEGFKYDSSIFPIRHDLYGIPDAHRFPFTISLKGLKETKFDSLELSNNGLIAEFPVSTLRLFGYNLPIAGGGYFRLYPYWLTKWGLKRINEKEKRPFIFYIHPWELDPAQPRFKNASLLSKFRHYNNLAKTETRFKKLLGDFNFAPVKKVLGL